MRSSAKSTRFLQRRGKCEARRQRGAISQVVARYKSNAPVQIMDRRAQIFIMIRHCLRHSRRSTDTCYQNRLPSGLRRKDR